jgi:hypothetical protein
MTVYGTEIIHQIPLPMETPSVCDIRYSVELDDRVPADLRNAMRCGMALYRAHGRRVFLFSDRPVTRSASEQPWCYEAEGAVRFWWRSGTGMIHCERLGGTEWTKVEFWLLHLLLPLWLSLERRYHFFHAGAVEIGDRPVLFLAPSMGGKSTMTDYFLRRGHGLISDDKVATFRENGCIMVAPAHPYHRPWRSFEDLGQRAERFVTGIRPLHALYLLERTDAQASVALTEIRGMEKLGELLPHFLYQFPCMKREQLAYLAPLLSELPLIRVAVPWDLKRLEEVYEAICADAERREGHDA